MNVRTVASPARFKVIAEGAATGVAPGMTCVSILGIVNRLKLKQWKMKKSSNLLMQNS